MFESVVPRVSPLAAAFVLAACEETATPAGPASPPASGSAATTQVDGLPLQVGQCDQTTIRSTGARLQGTSPLDSGSIIDYDNGGYQTSYSPEGGIFRSQVGDPVEMCLVSIPEDCPPGDDRGRIYRTTNLRTGEAWVLRDEPHFCGGA